MPPRAIPQGDYEIVENANRLNHVPSWTRAELRGNGAKARTGESAASSASMKTFVAEEGKKEEPRVRAPKRELSLGQKPAVCRDCS